MQMKTYHGERIKNEYTIFITSSDEDNEIVTWKNLTWGNIKHESAVSSLALLENASGEQTAWHWYGTFTVEVVLYLPDFWKINQSTIKAWINHKYALFPYSSRTPRHTPKPSFPQVSTIQKKIRYLTNSQSKDWQYFNRGPNYGLQFM